MTVKAPADAAQTIQAIADGTVLTAHIGLGMPDQQFSALLEALRKNTTLVRLYVEGYEIRQFDERIKRWQALGTAIAESGNKNILQFSVRDNKYTEENDTVVEELLKRLRVAADLTVDDTKAMVERLPAIFVSLQHTDKFAFATINRILRAANEHGIKVHMDDPLKSAMGSALREATDDISNTARLTGIALRQPGVGGFVKKITPSSPGDKIIMRD